MQPRICSCACRTELSLFPLLETCHTIRYLFAFCHDLSCGGLRRSYLSAPFLPRGNEIALCSQLLASAEPIHEIILQRGSRSYLGMTLHPPSKLSHVLVLATELLQARCFNLRASVPHERRHEDKESRVGRDTATPLPWFKVELRASHVRCLREY